MELDKNNLEAVGFIWGAEIDAANKGEPLPWLKSDETVWCHWGPEAKQFAADVRHITGWTEGFKIRLPRDHPHYGTTTPTPDKWGTPIAVNGVRPDWLRDECGMFENGPNNWIGGDDERLSDWVWSKGDCPIAIRLPSDHPYYSATAKGFKFWPGGDEAPGDWDGGEVICVYGAVIDFGSDPIWRDIDGAGTIIGYRPKPEYGKIHTDGSRSGRQPEATDDYVRVRRMTEDEWLTETSHGYTDWARRAGVIKPEPTALEMYDEVASLTPDHIEAIRAFIAWQESQKD